MRQPTQPFGRVNFKSGQTLSERITELYGVTLVGILVPVGSPLNGKTISFVQVFAEQNNADVNYDVVDDSGAAISMPLTAGTFILISYDEFSAALSRFKLKLNSSAASDNYLTLFVA